MNILLHIGRLAAICLLLSVSVSSSAQAVSETTVQDMPAVKKDAKMSHNIFGELIGPSFGIGLGFDSRFRNGTPFGYRVGISHTAGSYDNYEKWLDFKGVCFPLEINAIFGERKSKFEIGVGVTPAILHRDYTAWYRNDENTTGYIKIRERGTKLNIIGTINIGYRYQRERGFFLRTGFTIFVGDLKCSPIDSLWILPNLSLGYTLNY